MHFVYILYTHTYDKYYVGETEDIDTRLRLHNEGAFKGSSTSFATDWVLKIVFQIADRSEARLLESYIKSMKSKRFIERVISDRDFQKGFQVLFYKKYQIKIIEN